MRFNRRDDSVVDQRFETIADGVAAESVERLYGFGELSLVQASVPIHVVVVYHQGDDVLRNTEAVLSFLWPAPAKAEELWIATAANAAIIFLVFIFVISPVI